ncbi:MAG: serine hydrolase [Rhodospirillaceae bacterium]|jgi:CubicO group peptidase (beta-lactamase class C family)|nr:serine hydrolase [Rhodospirillaceae bacterium]MBT5812167.1 serine hydrolase [Rhodospirillaceae bacterium]
MDDGLLTANGTRLNAEKLAAATAFAESAETRWPYDLDGGLSAVEKSNEPAPWNEVTGPMMRRGKPNGLIIKDGATVAEWGDPSAIEMTYSAAKSYLSLLTGIAVDDGLIRSIDDPMRDYALDRMFHTDQNHDITWRQMLQLTSEWEGSLWDKPDLVDRNRELGVGVDNSKKGTPRALQKPGTHWEYNDVRVNRFSLSLMQVFRRPLPDVLRTRIMDPIGASSSWRWHHYRNSFYEIGGVPIPSVPGGTHWGGGLWINSHDHALMGQLMLAKGQWKGQRIISEAWIDALRTPCDIRPGYGLLWWLNTGREYMPNAPESSYFAIGAGKHMVWIEPENNIVAVARWIDAAKANDFIGHIMACIE